jgi:hypothetical protein
MFNPIVSSVSDNDNPPQLGMLTLYAGRSHTRRQHMTRSHEVNDGVNNHQFKQREDNRPRLEGTNSTKQLATHHDLRNTEVQYRPK